MKMQLLPLLFSTMFCASAINCPKVDMTKLYKITQTPATGAASDINQKIPGIDVKFCNDDEIIIITFNTPDDQLTQNVTLSIAAADTSKPNLLTIKTYEDIENLITVSTDKTAVNVALGASTPEGKIVLVYNGEVDVKLISPEADVATEQKYMLKNPFFINQTTPVDATVTTATFRISNYTAVDFLLCFFYETALYLKDQFCCVSISDECLRELSRIFNAEKTRNCLAMECCNTKKVTKCSPVPNVLDFEIDNLYTSTKKFNLEQCIKPTTCIQKDSLNISITNAIAVSTIFEMVDLHCGDDDIFYLFMKAFVDIKTEITIQDACSIMYNIIESFCETSPCKSTYLECVQELGIDVKCLYTSSIDSDEALQSCLSSHISSYAFETEVAAEVTAEVVEEEKQEDSETSESTKKKEENKGMSTTKKVVIVSVIVVLVVSATVGAVMVFA